MNWDKIISCLELVNTITNGKLGSLDKEMASFDGATNINHLEVTLRSFAAGIIGKCTDA